MDALRGYGELGLGSRLKRLSDNMMKEIQLVYDYFNIDFDPYLFPIIKIIDHSDGVTNTEIKTKLNLSQPAITQAINKLISKGLVVAKSDKSHKGLVELFKSRQIKKVYHAIVVGCPDSRKGRISQAIGRHRGNRKKMAVLEHGGRDAVTCWTVLEELPHKITYIEVRPETGRTHQIRVHMAFLGHPVAGDGLYGGKQLKMPVEAITIERQCLHAYSLSFHHPVTGESMEFTSPVWPDMQAILESIRNSPTDS